MNKSKRSGVRKFLSNTGVLVILLAMIILMAILRPTTFMKPQNLINIVRQVCFYGMVGLGAMIVLVGGDFDLSVGTEIGLVSVVTGLIVSEDHAGLPTIVAFFAAILVGVIVGLINGILVAYGEMPAFIATLGTQLALRGLALVISGGRPIGNLPDSFVYLGQGSLFGWLPVPIVIFIIMSVITWYFMKYTRTGRHIYAIGGNKQAAIVSGVDAKKLKVLTFILSAVTAAIAGMILSGRVATGNANNGDGYEMQAISGCVIGGVSLAGGIGSVYSVICGVLVIGVLNNGMDLLNISGYWQQIVNGVVLIVAVLMDVQREKRTGNK